MTTETILTDDQIENIADINDHNRFTLRAHNDKDMARAIEQAVLQSPEIQSLRQDAKRYSHLRECNSSRLMIIEMQDIGDDPCDRVLVGTDADTYIDADMEKQK